MATPIIVEEAPPAWKKRMKNKRALENQPATPSDGPASVPEKKSKKNKVMVDNNDSNPPVSAPEKKSKKNKVEDITEHGDELANAAANLNPMERRKHRKSMDKEKHKRPKSIDSEKPNEKQDTPTSMELASGSGSGSILPEFHLGVFDKLAAVDASTREAAARSLVTELKEIQDSYDKLESKADVEGESRLEAEKDDGLDNCAPSVRYAVRRLIRGVQSSRECARQGFALGLTILVGTIPSIKLESLLKLIINLLEVSSSKGQEARESLLGRLFAYGALARSGKVTEEWSLNTDTPLIKEITSCVINLGAKKRYIQEPAVSIILEIAEKLPTEALSNNILEASGLQKFLEGATEVGNPDALLLALKLREKVSVDNKFGSLLPSPYSKSALFAAEHLSNISNCLKESAFCQPRVHGVWPILVNILLPDSAQGADSAPALNSCKKHKKSRKSGLAEEDIERDLRSFCQVIIEGSLLPSSHDRKKLAFDVVSLLLPKLPAACVQIVMSYKVVQCLIDILSTKDSWLYKVAQHFLKVLSEWVLHDDVRRVEVIMALQRHSNGKFDSITRSRTVKDLVTEFKTESGCLLFIQNLITMFLDEGHSSDEPSDQSQTTDENSEIGSINDNDAFGTGTSEFPKSWIVETLPSVSKHLKLDQDARSRVQKEVLKFLAVQGLFSSSLGTEVTSFELQEKVRWPKVTISSALCQMCIEQLQLLLSDIQKGEGAHAVSSGTGIEANDLGCYFMRFISILCNIPSVSLSRTLSTDDEQAFKKLQAMESQLSREERNSGTIPESRKLHALRHLLIQLLLQILLRPGEFFEAASEVVICCKKAFDSSSNDIEFSGEDESDDDEAPLLMDVLVDTMLSILPNSSAPVRAAIEQVFKCFCKDVTDDGLLRMLRVIKKDLKPARHQNSDSEEDDTDDDILGVEEDNESDESETGETADADGQTDDSELVGAVEPVGAPEGSDDDSDGGLDDDAMFRIDQKLATMVRERSNKSGVETAHSQLVLFKLRVLSLLEIYVHENPDKAQVLKVFSSLAQALTNPQTTEGSEQLGHRISGIIQKKIFKARDCPKGEEVQLGTLESLLEKYLKVAAKPFKRKKSISDPSKKKQSASWQRYKMITSLAKNSTFWILRIIDAQNISETERERVYEIFKSTLVSYFDSKKSQLKPDFLKEIFRRKPWVGHHLFGFLLDKCSNANSQFRQVEALDLVMEILKPLLSSKKEESIPEESMKLLQSNMSKLSHLLEHFVTNMPEKQSRRAQVRKFYGNLFRILGKSELTSSFLKALEPDCHSACESQLGDMFLALKKKVH